MTRILEPAHRSWQVCLAPCMLALVPISVELAVLRHFPNQAVFAVGLTMLIVGLTRIFHLSKSEVIALFGYAILLTLFSMPSYTTNCGPIKIPIEQRTHEPLVHAWGWAMLAANSAIMGLSLWFNRLMERRKRAKRISPIDGDGRDQSWPTSEDDLFST